jgi:hypothetical protein
MSSEPIPGFWPELPSNRCDIDHVHEALLAWGEWAEIGREEAAKYDLGRYGIVHIIECALLLWLAPYASKRNFDSEIFQNGQELGHALEYAFELGYPREMAEALQTCYSFEEPWEISPDWAKCYANQLTAQLKDLALYERTPSEFWKQKIEELRAEKETLSASLETIHGGSKKRSDAKDKEKFIAWVKNKNIVVAAVAELLNSNNKDWPLDERYAEKTIRAWYKEAMPHVTLKSGRPKKSTSTSTKNMP